MSRLTLNLKVLFRNYELKILGGVVRLSSFKNFQQT